VKQKPVESNEGEAPSRPKPPNPRLLAQPGPQRDEAASDVLGRSIGHLGHDSSI